jgi:2-methylisocitrate lyase-like PEP mutase family enzyme
MTTHDPPHQPESQHARARAFREMHAPAAGRVLVLPNAWDAMSARMIERAGAPAIATTSAGVSWGLGRRDGHGVSRDAMLDVVRRIVAVVRVPVTADVEGGYGAGTPDDVAATVRGALDAGAVGVNLEDSSAPGGGLHDVAAQAERIAAAREAAGEAGAFLNARIDTYLLRIGPDAERFDETVRRAHAYARAGADGVFIPGVVDAPTVRRLAAAVPVPLNVMAGPGAPSVAELRALGVARVSLGPTLAQAAMAAVGHAATAVLRDGTYEALAGALPFQEADALFGPRAA